MQSDLGACAVLGAGMVVFAGIILLFVYLCDEMLKMKEDDAQPSNFHYTAPHREPAAAAAPEMAVASAVNVFVTIVNNTSPSSPVERRIVRTSGSPAPGEN
jgi:hypothetical protein